MTGNYAAFLDRDGVLNHDYGYVGDWERFIFTPGAIEACGILKNSGYLIIIVTNQSGIARNYFSMHQYEVLQKKIEDFMLRNGVKVTHTYVCPHHPDGVIAEYTKSCKCRKPAPGLILKAASEYRLKLSSSIMFGDKESDKIASKAAGVGSFIGIGETLGGYENLYKAVIKNIL